MVLLFSGGSLPLYLVIDHEAAFSKTDAADSCCRHILKLFKEQGWRKSDGGAFVLSNLMVSFDALNETPLISQVRIKWERAIKEMFDSYRDDLSFRLHEILDVYKGGLSFEAMTLAQQSINSHVRKPRASVTFSLRRNEENDTFLDAHVLIGSSNFPEEFVETQVQYLVLLHMRSRHLSVAPVSVLPGILTYHFCNLLADTPLQRIEETLSKKSVPMNPIIKIQSHMTDFFRVPPRSVYFEGYGFFP